MEALTHCLSLTVVPFLCIFAVISVWWGLVDLSVRKIKGRKRALWTLLVILLPPIGTLLYTSMHKGHEATHAG